MTLQELNDKTCRDRARYARGARRSLQRKFGMIYAGADNSLGCRPQVGHSLETVDAYALELMRMEHPGFTPELA